MNSILGANMNPLIVFLHLRFRLTWRRAISFAAVVGLLALAPAANAQYPYPYNPYNPYAGRGPGYNYGAAAQGQAAVMQASGQVTIDNENARILREQANQAKLDTKRKAFDQM